MNLQDALASGRIAKDAKRATKKQFEAAMAKIGATLDEDCSLGALVIDAPAGFVFGANGCHALVCTSEEDGMSIKPYAYADAIERMAYGVRLCTDTDCEVC
jgi:hypothetical protein